MLLEFVQDNFLKMFLVFVFSVFLLPFSLQGLSQTTFNIRNHERLALRNVFSK